MGEGHQEQTRRTFCLLGNQVGSHFTLPSHTNYNSINNSTVYSNDTVKHNACFLPKNKASCLSLNSKHTNKGLLGKQPYMVCWLQLSSKPSLAKVVRCKTLPMMSLAMHYGMCFLIMGYSPAFSIKHPTNLGFDRT